MSGEHENLHKEALCLLLLIKSLKTQIKENEIQLIEERDDSAEDQDDIEVMESINKLETAIINANSEYICHEKALKGAQMNWIMFQHLRLNSTNEMQVEMSPMEKDKQMSALGLIRRNTAEQTKYLEILKEVEDLQEQVIKMESMSLARINQTRKLKQELDDLGKDESRRGRGENDLETRLERLLQENLRTYRMVASTFQELIFCSKVDYNQTPEMQALVLSMGKELELEK